MPLSECQKSVSLKTRKSALKGLFWLKSSRAPNINNECGSGQEKKFNFFEKKSAKSFGNSEKGRTFALAFGKQLRAIEKRTRSLTECEQTTRQYI